MFQRMRPKARIITRSGLVSINNYVTGAERAQPTTSVGVKHDANYSASSIVQPLFNNRRFFLMPAAVVEIFRAIVTTDAHIATEPRFRAGSLPRASRQDHRRQRASRVGIRIVQSFSPLFARLSPARSAHAAGPRARISSRHRRRRAGAPARQRATSLVRASMLTWTQFVRMADRCGSGSVTRFRPPHHWLQSLAVATARQKRNGCRFPAPVLTSLWA